MTTLGLIFVLGGFLLGRQVITGRVKETPEDIRDMTLALLSGDFDTLQRTLAQRGENVTPDVTGTVAASASGVDAPSQILNGNLLAATVALGNAAKGYVYGGSGPDYYDCSGLVWAAMKQTGQYTGKRFTTGTFVPSMSAKIAKVATPSAGDIALWPGHHMGVMSNATQVYSAMSPSAGIGYSTVDGITKTVGVQPVYYRVNA